MITWRLFLLGILVATFSSHLTPIEAQSDLTITSEAVLGKGFALSSAWSPDGETIAVGSSNSLWLYTNTLEEVKQLAVESAIQLLWGPQGDMIVSENNHGVAIWNVTTDTKMVQLDGYSFPAAWSPDGTMLTLVAPDNRIVLWDSAEQRECVVISVNQQNSASSIRFLAWNAEKIVGIASDYDSSTWVSHSTFFVWSSRTGELLSAVQPDSNTIDPSDALLAELVSLNPLSSEIVLADYNHFLRFDIQNEHPLVVSESRNLDLYDLAISPDEKHFVTIDQTLWQISIWDTETLTLLDTVGDGSEVSESVSHVNWSPDGKYLLTDSPGIVKIWDIETGHVLHRRTDYMTHVNDLAWSPDGRLLATANGQDFPGVWDFRVRLWNVQNSSIFAVCEGASGPIWSVDWNPEGTQLITTGGGFHFSDDKLRIWNAVTCRSADTVELGTRLGAVSAWSPNGRYIAAQVGGAIEMWEADDLSQEPKMLPVGLTEGVVWHPIHSWLVVVLWGQIEIYDANDAEIHHPLDPFPQVEPIQTLSPTYFEWARALAWNYDGTYLAVGGGSFRSNDPETPQNYTIEIWNVSTSTLEHTLIGHEDGITSLSWDPTGRYLASASADTTVRVWDTTTGEQIALLEGHTDSVSVVAWSPDGLRIASGSLDGTVRIWRVTGR